MLDFANAERVLQYGMGVVRRGISYVTTSEAMMKSILDPSFRYTKSVETDLRKTFARVRRELRKQQQSTVANNVQPIRRDQPLRMKAN